MRAPFSLPRAASIARKEFQHILRDPLSTKVMILFPLALVCFFGYAIDFEVRDVDVLVSDGDQTRRSRELIDVLDKSAYFQVRHVDSVVRAGRALGEGRAKAVLIIGPRYQRDTLRGRSVSAQVLLDGSDDQTAAIISSYLAGVQQAVHRRLGQARATLELRTRFLFNEELNSRWFIVPGLFALILGIFSTLLPALTVAREWENGSMELLLSTPVRPLDIIVGKLAPYFALCLANAAAIYMLARVVFGVPFLGSHLVMAAGTVLFLTANLAQGLLISVTMRAQRLAYQTSMQTGTWPVQLLSGFVFPVENMPTGFRWLVALLPARWYMTILRSTFLRAAGPSAVAAPMAALGGLTLLFVSVAWLRFKTDLEP